MCDALCESTEVQIEDRATHAHRIILVLLRMHGVPVSVKRVCGGSGRAYKGALFAMWQNNRQQRCWKDHHIYQKSCERGQ